ncbi:MAG: choice-of-anchor J domain-containing protein [Trueperaceae bacterium]
MTPQWIDNPTFTETFDDITTLETTGWAFENLSTEVGDTSWFQGNADVFVAHEGAPTTYIAANYNNTTGTSTISNWAFLPEWQLRNGDEFSFYTRSASVTDFPDRLEVRLSTSGASVDAGTDPESTGDFDTLLVSINPDLLDEYPVEWTERRMILEGLPAGETVSGRLAFRYYVTNSGPGGFNGNYIGIDSVSYLSYQPGYSTSSALGTTSACEAGATLTVAEGDEYYLCHTLTNEGNLPLTLAEWSGPDGATGDLSTLTVPLTELAAGASATWVTGPHTAVVDEGFTRVVLPLGAAWQAGNPERTDELLLDTSPATITINKNQVLTATPTTLADTTVTPGGSADLLAFDLESTGVATTQVTAFELTATVDVDTGTDVDVEALLSSLSVLVDGATVASSAAYTGDSVVLTLATPLAIDSGTTAAITVRATTSNTLPQFLAAGALAFAGLGLSLRSRRRQLLALAAVMVIALAACSSPAPKRNVTFSVQLTEVMSDAGNAVTGVPLTGPEIAVTY